MSMTAVWTIAGSDSCGGAGVSADMQTFHNLHARGAQVVTAVTSQNLNNIIDIYNLPSSVIRNQINALHHIQPAAVKIGMLGSVEAIAEIRQFLQNYSGFSVLDPLFHASSGQQLFAGELEDYRRHLITLFPDIYLLTPNKMEAEILLQRRVTSYAEMEAGARDLIAMGVKNVLMKGGHFGGEFSQDYWTNGKESCWLSSRRYPDKDCHGTGCVTSSAIAACLALNYEIKDALVIAKMVVNRGIRLAKEYFCHAYDWPEHHDDLPIVSHAPVNSSAPAFNCEDQYEMGLYPIIDSVAWLQKLVPLGVRHIQLRIKNLTGAQLENEIRQAIELAKKYDAKLFINDYWQLAIQHHAYGVHLGQEDLETADIAAIHAAGLRLGISTHCYYEVARAHALQPSYIACGPIYPTNSKIMKFAPQGTHSLSRWRKTLRYPLVAIGGIHSGNINTVLAEKIDGIAVISAVTQADHPVMAAQQLLNEIAAYAA